MANLGRYDYLNRRIAMRKFYGADEELAIRYRYDIEHKSAKQIAEQLKEAEIDVNAKTITRIIKKIFRTRSRSDAARLVKWQKK